MPLPGLLAWLLLCAALPHAGCATTSPRSAPSGLGSQPGQDRIWVVREGSCCEPTASAAAEELLRRVAQRRRATLVPVARGAVSGRTTRSGDDVRQVLGRAVSLYVALSTTKLRRELERAQAVVDRTAGEGLVARELAQLQLLLGALAHAEGNSERARHHFRLAVGHDPGLSPDPDTFSPAIRTELSRARSARRPIDVVIRSVPPGAQILFDGAPSGVTPLTLRATSDGEHYLRLEAPCYRPWTDRVRFRNAAHLEARLEPRPATELATIFETQAENRAQAAAVLGGAGVALVSASDGGAQVEVWSPHAARPSGARRVGPATPPEELDRAAGELASFLAPGPTPERPEEGSRRPGFFRRTWWVWALVVGVAAPVAIAVPLAVSGGSSTPSDPDRPVRLRLP
ncbi:MAG: PEGA domain-containing protein [Deltaproteobacteria bacterium]|nr:PEGA domain-containing protein [Deltaproteobacteria bacterium]